MVYLCHQLITECHQGSEPCWVPGVLHEQNGPQPSLHGAHSSGGRRPLSGTCIRKGRAPAEEHRALGDGGRREGGLWHRASVFSLWGRDLGLNLGSATSSVLFSESFCFRGICKGPEVGAKLIQKESQGGWKEGRRKEKRKAEDER